MRQWFLSCLAFLPLVVPGSLQAEERTLSLAPVKHSRALAAPTRPSALWIACEHEIRKTTSAGATIASVTSVFGRGFAYGTGFADFVDADVIDGSVWVIDVNNDRIIKLDAAGIPQFETAVVSPLGIAVNLADGSIWTSQLTPAFTRDLVKITSHGEVVVRVAGFSTFVSAIAADDSANVWVADRFNNQVVKLFGSDQELDGYDASMSDGPHHFRVGGFSDPSDLAVTAQSDSEDAANVWVADRNHGQAVKLSPAGHELVRAEPARASDMRYVALNRIDGTAWFGTPQRIVHLSSRGLVLDSLAFPYSPVGPNNLVYSMNIDPGDYNLLVGINAFEYGRLVRMDASGTALWSIGGLDIVRRVIPVPPVHARVDIAPGSHANAINLSSRGRVGVAILGSSALAVAMIDVRTITLAGAPILLSPLGDAVTNVRDIDWDGREDLVVFVEPLRMQLTAGETVAVLDGRTYDGIPITGSDRVTIVGHGMPHAATFGMAEEVVALSMAVPPVCSSGEIQAQLTLPSAAPARLDLFDVSGRQLVLMDVDRFGVGHHTVTLEQPVVSGVYWLRLSQEGRRITKRVLLVR